MLHRREYNEKEEKMRNILEIENEIIKLRALLITQPLNSSIKTYIKQNEDCLKKYFPESKVLIKEVDIKIKKASVKKKKSISATIKRLVWNTNIGEEIGKSKCMCCKSTDITQMSFNCGHIIAEANGGDTIVSNLKPICQNCNSSMGTKNMNEFMISLK